ncbi:MAG: hypothetical protein S4CHLAM81_05890 [Chlamydiales bacterium]|nr:hypothetical protein [Chlamydiales bacterium]MCH9635374.1 hypothetical protein [Chlamydiales bacterium]MCH9703807.1 hypothetical protein [Chlamydiota bacterium]
MQSKTQNKIAVVAARGLGDGLLYLVLSNNLLRAGYTVTTFSTILCQLADWFPQHTILPFDQLQQSSFDHTYAADHSIIRKEDASTTILFEKNFDKRKSMVKNLQIASQRICQQGSCETGVTIPTGLKHRLYRDRVILHPMSTDIQKNWHPESFRQLAKKLTLIGLNPIFVVSPAEKSLWPEAKSFQTISDLAAFIYESGYLIGNDSGPGHLASLFGIPTLSLFARKSYSKLWKPGWFPQARVVCPKIPLIGAPMKQRYWKSFLTVKQVTNSFKHLIKTI